MDSNDDFGVGDLGDIDPEDLLGIPASFQKRIGEALQGRIDPILERIYRHKTVLPSEAEQLKLEAKILLHQATKPQKQAERIARLALQAASRK